MTSGRFCAAAAAFLALLLWVDRFVDLPGQLGLGAATWLAFLAALRYFDPVRRAQAVVVVAVATCGELVGSIVWGVYTYRLHNLPSFVPPAHGLVYLAGLALSRTELARRHTRALVLLAGGAAGAWGLAGLSVLPQRDVAGAIGVPLLLVFLWRSGSRAAYAGVFVVVAALELYGTSIGTWHWAATVPGSQIPDGNPPSGVASGYVCFDVIALALAPRLLGAFEAARTRLPALVAARL